MYIIGFCRIPHRSSTQEIKWNKINQSARNGSSTTNYKNETYYEILKLKRDCTSRDIRESFVKLSKKYHPDVSSGLSKAEQTAQFIKLSEAYKTLIKPKARYEYDQHLENHCGGSAHTSFKENSFQYGNIYRPRDVRHTYDPNPDSFYGIKGVRRVANWKLALVITTFGLFAGLVQLALVKHSFTLDREKIRERNEMIRSYHETAVANAKKLGKEKQLEQFAQRREKSTPK